MDRKEIKEAAKAKIKGNIWNLLWPVLAISAIEYVITLVFHLSPNVDFSNLGNTTQQMSAGASFGAIILGIVIAILMVGYKKYVLDFVRTGKLEVNEIFNCIKEKWLNILLVEILTGILVGLAAILFVIPGIILALAYAIATYLVIDTNLGGVDAMKQSREMMKGYKADYFVFGLSFIGWILLVPFTLGFLLIWLVPYMTVADAIYYDKLKEKTGK